MSHVSRFPMMLLLALVCLDDCYTASIPRSFDPRLSDEIVMAPKKRPFCNAFTGCGRKRSQGSPGMPLEMIKQRQFLEEDGYAPVMDSLESNAIEDLSRQILSDAKLWEAIQEASAEIVRRKQNQINFNSN